MPDDQGSFLDLLYTGAPRADFDRLVEEYPERAGEHDVALRLRDLIARHRSREGELSALYETARDLTAIRDLDEILTAIVRRARSLLGADMTYLSLNDEVEGASYMKVTDGALTREFQTLRLPLGTGLLGLVAQTGAPYFTEDYQSDERFVHRHYIDDAVGGERIRAILGVPLLVEGRVIGALLAVHRTVRRFPADEVSLLTSFAAHASVALENARLFARLDEANRTISAHASSVEAAALAHERMTDLLLAGGGVAEVVDVLGEVLGGESAAWDPRGQLLAGTDLGDGPAIMAAAEESARSGHAIRAGDTWVSAAVAAGEHVATVALRRSPADLVAVEQRTIERGALVTALVLVFARSVAEASERLGTQLLVDLVEGRELDADRLRERARRHTFDPDTELVLATVLVDGDRGTAARAAARVAVQHRGLSAEHHGDVLVLAPAGDAMAFGRAVRDALGEGATVGVASTSVGEVPAAYDSSHRAAVALRALGRSGDVADHASLGLASLLLGDASPDAVEHYIDQTLGPVLAHDERRGTTLLPTLDAWFEHGGAVAGTAEALHVHPNTVSQRLGRVAELLGTSWRDPARALEVQVALRLLRLQKL
ncbi:helix-turn-helix domain-containing protein [Nocardioides currus]|uniref:Diguanylate phosphodiesterase n=1 Tax=Nocardioides currus TaxID=2133958 RepID=A0A2R7Z159_9ACTN|nr:helix-turn-helix domain-containing protein [Nocardioides currus]PUA81879.1 diguanylate phosphodiesterase [Nocardioides currus]